MTGYLTYAELVTLLRKPYFQTFPSINVSQYALYRGHFNVEVLTMRFSLLKSVFDEKRMINSVINEVLAHFPPTVKSVRGLIQYDVILESKPMDQVDKSFYFWRANSNRHHDVNEETIVPLDQDNLFLFIRQAAHISPTDLDLFFVNSNVSVYQITSIIFTFISA